MDSSPKCVTHHCLRESGTLKATDCWLLAPSFIRTSEALSRRKVSFSAQLKQREVMNVKKHLRSRGHSILFAGGCVLACGGIYLWSQRTEVSLTWKALAAYVMIVLGFLAAMIGLFWSICRSMKSKLYQSRRRQLQQHIHVHTIHR